MKAKLSLLFVVCFFSFSAIAQIVKEEMSHKVEPGQTLYFISKKYELSIDDLRKSNPVIEDDLIIKPAQVLIIPVKKEPTKFDGSAYKTHVIQTKETLFSISQMYNIEISELIRLNNLENASIDIGQELKVQKLDVNDAAIYTKSTRIAGEGSENEIKKETPKQQKYNEDVLLYKQLFDSYGTDGYQINQDKGIGNYLDGNSSGAYLAMVNNVTAEQIIKVRNLMNNKVIYLKVVGPVSTKDADKNITIKISKSAANDLNIIENRFLAEWTWYSRPPQENEAEVKPSTTFDDF
ncbi:LysM peptidoglycan-binding domain-containing protein [Chitinophagales bacterium]|nr:LysM peptidoglycan-binding domain-containing protein [Chitinophagales bacterium]